MIKKHWVVKSTEVIQDVICDLCGQTCMSRVGMDESRKFFEFMSLKAKWGYGSDHDLEEWTAQVCESCVMEKLKPLIQFDVREYLAFQ